MGTDLLPGGRPAAVTALALLCACGQTREHSDLWGNGTAAAAETGASATGLDEGGTETLQSGGATDPGGSEATTEGVKFDIAGDSQGVITDTSGGVGCEKVDFLFVIDNSGSMQDEQTRLVAAFPEFINTIQTTLTAQDYHIMVVDTDGFLDGGNCNGAPPSCCDSYCAASPLKLCGGNTCPGIDPCMAEIGSGRIVSSSGTDCGVTGGNSYMLHDQPDLPGTFACVAEVGTIGDGKEVQIQALTQSIGPLDEAGACNEGFLRDDAILVVTIITDEEDDPSDGGDPDPGSPGDPQAWHDTLVAAKNGDPGAVVVLGLVGDTDLPNALCQPLSGGAGAEPAPRLRQFVELFGDRGIWASVCEPSYAPFFEQAVSHIDTACDEFEPPG